MPSVDRPVPTDPFLSLVEQTVARYHHSGRFVQGFVRGKLKHDPLYRQLVSLDLPSSGGLILDLGCGRGITMTLLDTARRTGCACARPSDIPMRLVGIEQRCHDADAARMALGMNADIITGDIRIEAIPCCRVALLLDVLLYMGQDEQDALLQRVADALSPEGVLIIREADRCGAWRFRLTRLAERMCAWARGEWRTSYHYRSQQAWEGRLTKLGFGVETRPMSQGTPFANVLFLARRSPRPARIE